MDKVLQLLKQFDPVLFPKIDLFNRKISSSKQVLIFVLFFALFSMFGFFFRPDHQVGFNWIHFYSQGIVPPFYPPWTQLMINH